MTLITGMVIFFSTCVEKSPDARATGDIRGERYAGAAACVSCHRGIHDSALHSSHYLSTQPASKEAIRGSFTPPDNEFHYNGDRRVVMQARDSGLFQVAMKGDQVQDARRFDIVMGSGRKGQTYLYWQGDSVGELPVSYFRMAGGWGNSPRYSMDSIWYGRMAHVECFACHTAYIKVKKEVQINAFQHVDQFDRTRVVYGIDCERCHGPAAAHVKYQQAHPEDKEAKNITRWASLSSQRRTDVCGICHAGARGFTRGVFGFRPGDTLTNFFYPEVNVNADVNAMDVHGNQYGLFTASKCYLRSQSIECATCHDVHVSGRKSLAFYSAKCMSCHQVQDVEKDHKMNVSKDLKLLTSNCIDCHMPVGASKLIPIQRDAGKDIMAHLARRHLIAVYPDAGKVQEKR